MFVLFFGVRVGEGNGKIIIIIIIIFWGGGKG